MAQRSLRIRTHGRGFHNITDRVQQIVQEAGVPNGVCHAFLRHTSASLLITENADPAVLRDLERFVLRIAPDGDPAHEHDAEGPDDMPAHIRSLLAGVAVTAPIGEGRLLLGVWQGVFLWEHRTHGHEREVIVTIVRA
jgi:secondary thiamine-phosphate synthase enzyme